MNSTVEVAERDMLLERLVNLRTILPVMGEELANARREAARLRRENQALREQLRCEQRYRTPVHA